MDSWMFKLRGELNSRQNITLAAIGIALFLAIWFILTMGETPILKPATLPSPWRVFTSYGDLYRDNDLLVNTTKSVGLNVSGYVLAMLISIPLGFLIGLIPLFRGLFQRFLDAIRFIPLTATIAIFIVWFGIGITMKSAFMAFGILIFFLPVVVQRIDEVDSVYLKTVYTLGATDWQTIKSVYFPAVMSKLWDDIRIMTAISWTYIVFVEAIGSQGGLGNLILYGARRQGRVDKMFALLILIIFIGIIQDRIFVYMSKKLFPHKYQQDEAVKRSQHHDKSSVFENIWDFIIYISVWLALAAYIILSLDELFGILGHLNIISYFFGGTSWVIHLIFLGIIAFKLKEFVVKRTA